MGKWYVYTSKRCRIGNYIPRSLQLDVKDIMYRLFYYRGMFFAYVFQGDELLDLDFTFTKQEALDFINNKINK